MNWRHMLFLSGFMVFLLLIDVDGRRSMMKATTGSSSEEIPDLKKKLFVQRLDASNFLKRHKKSFARSSEEFDDRTRSENLEREFDSTTEDNREELHESTERHWDVYEYFEY